MLTKLTILGKSDATIAMMLDILESLNLFPHITIVNNLNLPIEHPFDNKKFKWNMVTTVPEDLTGPIVVGATYSDTKMKIVDVFGDSYNFVNLIHSTSSISSTAKLGKGLMINNNTSISAHTTIGDFVSLNRNASIGHHTVVEDFVNINPGVVIAGHVTIGEGSKIGMGAMIVDGVSIGKNSVIGAGSVVIKDIPDNVVAYGSPCKIIRTNGV
jgi:sugar O-acyltransferase (sialic acid O-acetyltransferase NeuD family)